MLKELLFSGWNFNLFGVSVLISYSSIFTLALLYYFSRALLKGDWNNNSARLTSLGILVILASLVFHELSHAIVASFFGTTIDKAGLGFLMAYVSSSDTLLIAQNSLPAIIVFFAGPAGQLATGIVCAKMFHKLSESTLKILFWLGAIASVRLAMLNFLPVRFFDGGKMTYKILYILSGEKDANFFMPIISGIALFFLIYRGVPSGMIEKYLKIKKIS